MLAAQLLEVALQQGPHGDDAVGHALDLSKPLLVELRVVEDLGCDPGAVDGRVRVHGPGEDFDLRFHPLLLLGRPGQDREGADALAVEPLHRRRPSASCRANRSGIVPDHVLCKRLAERNLVALRDKVSQRVRVLVGAARGEALVGHVEEGQVAARLDGVADGTPLLRRGIDAGGVVGAGVQQEDGALGRILDVPQQAVDIEPDGLLVVVAVGLDVQAAVVKDGPVVCPRRRWQVHRLVVGVEALQEGAGDPEGSGAGNGLRDGHAVQHRIASAIGEHASRLSEGGNAGDARILLVQALFEKALLGGTHRRKNVWLARIVTVGANTWLSQLSSVASSRAGWQGKPRLIFFSNLSALNASVMPGWLG